jgi:oligosaccharyltransferase complex subunit alpha (ribophorin I)
MMNLRVLVYLLLLAFVHTTVQAIDVSSLTENFVNERVIRTVDLSTSVVKEDIGIKANNTGSKATTAYHFAIPITHHNTMASYHAFLKQKAKQRLVMEPAGFDQLQYA